MAEGYTIRREGRAVGEEGITCHACNRTSYNPIDVANRYCPACHTFHLDPLADLERIGFTRLAMPAFASVSLGFTRLQQERINRNRLAEAAEHELAAWEGEGGNPGPVQ